MMYENHQQDLQIDFNEDDVPDLIETDINDDGIPDDLPIYFDETEHLFTDSDLDIIDPDPNDEYHKSVSELDNLEPTDTIDPGNDLDYWHQQNHPDTCAIVSQEFVLDELGKEYGIKFTEEQLRQEAIDLCWYTPGGGTPLDCVGNLIEAHGVEVERESGCSFADLAHKLEDGQKVIVALDSDEIWNCGIDEDDLVCNYLGLPEQDANHAVQVVGIDRSDPKNPIIILNDPGTPNGKGLRVPANEFVDAWEDSNYYMVSTTGRNIDPNQTQLALEDDGNYLSNVRLGSVTEGNYQKSWGDSYKRDADDARDWAERYRKEGNVDKVMEFEKKAAEAQRKAHEYYQKAQEAYRNP